MLALKFTPVRTGICLLRFNIIEELVLVQSGLFGDYIAVWCAKEV